jgi:CheY-like chemotaxis protein
MPRRILVADDNADSASSMALLLEILGNEVRTAGDGLEAVEVASSFRPDVILMDIGMPRLDGYDACRRIREEPWGRDIVLIALTGWSQDEDVRQARDAGFDHHLVKPVEPAALEKLLETGARVS